METKSKNNSITAALMLCTAALIWGGSFVAQKVGSGVVGPFMFIGVRTLLGSIVLLPVIWMMHARGRKVDTYKAPDVRKSVRWGVLCGVFLFLATVLQQVGIEFTTAGKSAFLSALYVVFVPVFSAVAFKKKVGWNVWVGVLLTAVGLYLLCIYGTEDLTISRGDLITLACSIFFAFQIMAIERANSKKNRVDGVILSCAQFFTAGSLALGGAFLFENIDFNAVLSVAPALLYSGILSCGVAYTFQVLAQKKVEASAASLILSSESLFAVLAGAFILGESLGLKEIFGCVFIFAAILLSQLKKSKQ